MAEGIVAVDHVRGAGFSLDLNIQRDVNAAGFDALDILRQAENIVPAAATKIDIRHDLCNNGGIISRHPDSLEGLSDKSFERFSCIAEFSVGHIMAG
jgi:hypothetical protein